MKMPNTRQVRRILAVIIAATTFALIGTVLVRQLRVSPPASVPRPASPEIDMAINRLQFSEMRGDKLLWKLTAAQAAYDKEGGATGLVQVKTELFDGKADGMVITSRNGYYDEPRRLVRMQDQVQIVTRRGMELKTERLLYETGPGLISSATAVTVHDGRLSLQARGMRMQLDNETVQFTGPVTAVIEGYHGTTH